jgi:hypothetical protein
MRRMLVLAGLAVLWLPAGATVRADRPIEKREDATYVLSGTVRAVYVQDTKGYRSYIVELTVEQVTKGEGLKKGDCFRAFCYQRKEGAASLEFDTAGHTTVPKEGQRIKVFVNRARGRNEGIYPDWVDVLPGTKK